MNFCRLRAFFLLALAMLVLSLPFSAAAQAVLRLTDVDGRESAQFAIGERIEVVVEDPSLDVSASVDTHTVRATSALGGGDLLVPVTEDARPGVFRGSFRTITGSSTERLVVTVGDTLTIVLQPAGPSATATLEDSRVVFVDLPTGTATDIVLEDGNFGLRLFAPGANLNPSAVEYAQVRLSTRRAEDFETYSVQETAADSGVFQTVVSVGHLAFGATPNDFRLESAPADGSGDVVDAFPLYPLSGAGDSATVESSRVSIVDRASRGTGFVAIGGELRVRVAAPNQAQGGAVEQLQVAVSGGNGSGEDLETLTLTETDRHSQVFEGTLPMALPNTPAASGNGVFDPGPAGLVQVRHAGGAGYGDSVATAAVTAGTIEIVDAAGRPVNEVTEDGVVRLRAYSPYDRLASTVESVTVELRNPTTGDLESIILSETTAASSVFVGSLPLARGAVATFDGKLQTSFSGSPFIPENRVVASFQGASTSALVVGSRAFFLDRFGRVAERLVAGEAAVLRVEMPTADVSAAPDTLTFELVNESLAGDEVLVALTETAPTSGVFEGPIASAPPSAGGNVANRLDLAQGDRFRVDVVDPWGGARSTHATALYGRFDWVDAAGQLIAEALEGSDLYVEATAPGEDRTTAPENVFAAATSEIVGDNRSFGLTETGSHTGIFRGAVALRTDPVSNYDNYALETYELPGPPHQFDRVDVSAYFLDYGLYFDYQPLPLTGSRTSVLDAAGRPVAAVAVGSTLRIRVEDWNVDRFSNPPGTATTTVRVRVPATGDEEILNLVQETREGAFFVGTVELRQGIGSAPGDDAVAAQAGDLVVVEHDDFLGFSLSRAEVQAVAAMVLFLDEAGLPTAELLENGVARIRVVSVAGDTSSQPDTLALQVSSAVAGDFEFFGLTETGPSTHVFEGTVALPFGSSSLSTVIGDQQVQVSGPPDTVTALYADYQAIASAHTIGARVHLRDVLGAVPEAFALGETVTIEIEDPSRNLTESLDTVPVELHSALRNATFATDAFEVAPGLFRVAVPIHLAGHGSGGFTVARQDTLSLVGYTELHSGLAVGAAARVVDYKTYFLDEAGAPTSEVLESMPTRLRVYGEPADRNSYPDAIEMSFTAELGPDYESFYVSETGDSTGVFETLLGLRLSATASPYNYQLETYEQAGPPLRLDRIFARPFLTGPDYALDTGYGAEATVIASRTALVDAAGAAVDSLRLGQPIHLRVWDGNRNLTPNYPGSPPDTTTATITAGGDSETLTLTELEDDFGGVFQGTLPSSTSPPVPGNGVLESELAPIVVTAVHDDFLGLTSSADAATADLGFNQPPLANPDAATTEEDQPVAIAVLANDVDPDGDAVTLTVLTTPNGTAVVQPDGTVLYTPYPDSWGFDSFDYEVSDPSGARSQATVSMTITAVPDAPIAQADSVSIDEDETVSVDVKANDSDPDHEPLTVAITTAPGHGTAVVQGDGTVLYAPAANYFGADTFGYSVTDPSGTSASATVALTVNPVNDPPVAAPDAVSMTMESTLTFGTLVNDSDLDGDTLAITALGTPTNGTAVLLSSESLSYTPALNFAGVDSFSYSVSDGQGGTADSTVTITVNRPARVGTNLQVLYNFGEGQGTTVLDVSGVGTPMNLTIGSATAVAWQPGRLAINSATLIQSAGAATKVISAVRASSQVTLEAWALPRNLTQMGPAAIVTISQTTAKRNITLGQTINRWDTRLRTSTSGAGGVNLTSATGSLTPGLSHVVFTRDAAGAAKTYVNGVLITSFTTTGNLSTWVTSYQLGLAAELNGGKPWLGDLDLVAIYSRALTPTEVRQNYLSGPQ